MYLIQPAIVEFQCGYHYRLKKLFGKKVKTIRRKNKFSACIRQSWQCACKLVLRAKEFMSAMHRCSDQAVQSFACPVYTVYWDDGNCYSAPDRAAEYSDQRVCLCVCVCSSVCDHIFGTARPILIKVFVRVAYDRGSVLLWGRGDTLCISGFMDDVIFEPQLRLLDVAARLRQWSSHAALGLAHRNTLCRQRTLGSTSCSQGLLGRT